MDIYNLLCVSLSFLPKALGLPNLNFLILFINAMEYIPVHGKNLPVPHYRFANDLQSAMDLAGPWAFSFSVFSSQASKFSAEKALLNNSLFVITSSLDFDQVGSSVFRLFGWTGGRDMCNLGFARNEEIGHSSQNFIALLASLVRAFQ